MSKERNDETKDRRAILGHLEASRPYLEESTPHEIAKELMVQALDIVPPAERRPLFTAALEELNDEQPVRRRHR